MNASGIVIAASEVIRFETGCGILFIVYNMAMDLHFYIFTNDNRLQKLWKKILVNHIYKFSHLKIGAIELLSGIRKIVLLTTHNSAVYEIPENHLQKFNIPVDHMIKLSTPGILFERQNNTFCKLISYQGIVTKVSHSTLGIYELDQKVNLYCILNSSHALLTPLKVGAEVLVSNAHFFIDIQTRKVLVCCGLSSVRIMKFEDNSDEVPDVSLHDGIDVSNFVLHHYPLSIFDIIWLEALFVDLNAKFSSSVIHCDYIFDWESEIVNNILECCSLMEGTYSERLSIGDEFCSYPHACSVFRDDNLPTGCKTLFISEIMDNALSKVSWVENTNSWKTCIVRNPTKNILIGMLYLSKDGCWYVTDNSCNIPIILARSCDECNSAKNILCAFDDLNLGYLIALQNFDIVFEKIKYKNGNHCYYQYLNTSCCYTFYLGTFYKKENIFSPVSFSQWSNNKNDKQDNSIDEMTRVLETIHLDEQDLWTNAKMYSCNKLIDKDVSNCKTNQHVLVLNKIWTIVEQAFVCYQILILLLPQEEIYNDYLNKSKTLMEDSHNYYETNDDFDFAELVNRIDSLFLEDKPRLARLHFESTRQCASMLPGHIYAIDISGTFSKDINVVSSNKNSSKPFLMKIKPSTKITHHFKCRGIHYLDDYNVDVNCSIKQIVSERKTRENCVIRATLIDKLYEDGINSCGSQSSVNRSNTFCLIIKDCNFEDTIKVYLPFCPKNMYGFLPGTALQMYGFVCVCSKRGYLYLTPLSSFAMQIVNSQHFHGDGSEFMEFPESFSADSRLMHLQHIPGSISFKCLCFIIKLISVNMFLGCDSCKRDFKDKCSCLSNCSIKFNVNFLIDDGTCQAVAYSSGECAKKVLMISDVEWKKLTSYVTETMMPLKFHHKTIEDDLLSSSLMNQVFCAYCSNKSICRQVLLKCKRKFDGPKSEMLFVCCDDVLKIHETDLISELIVKVKNIEAKNL